MLINKGGYDATIWAAHHRHSLVQVTPPPPGQIRDQQPFYLDNIRIKQIHKTKYLGPTVDDKLSWNEQYKSVKGKVSGGRHLSGN